MPSIEQFLTCNEEYRNSVLPRGVKKIIIEAGSSFGWHRISNEHMEYITLSKFGTSGTTEEVLEYMNFDYETVRDRVFDIINTK
jgi:transketolase